MAGVRHDAVVVCASADADEGLRVMEAIVAITAFDQHELSLVGLTEEKGLRHAECVVSRCTYVIPVITPIFRNNPQCMYLLHEIVQECLAKDALWRVRPLYLNSRAFAHRPFGVRSLKHINFDKLCIVDGDLASSLPLINGDSIKHLDRRLGVSLRRMFLKKPELRRQNAVTSSWNTHQPPADQTTPREPVPMALVTPMSVQEA